MNKYECQWLKKKAVTVKGFYIEKYEAMYSAETDVLSQTITKSICKASEGFQIPIEQPNSIIIFGRLPQLPPLFKFKGKHAVYETHEVFSIPSMSVGGSLIKKTKDYLLLDSSYLIKLSNKKMNNLEDLNETLKIEKKMGVIPLTDI